MEDQNMNLLFWLLFAAVILFSGGCVWNAYFVANPLPDQFFTFLPNAMTALGTVFVQKIRASLNDEKDVKRSEYK